MLAKIDGADLALILCVLIITTGSVVVRVTRIIKGTEVAFIKAMPRENDKDNG